jgi:hypothetical protein
MTLQPNTSVTLFRPVGQKELDLIRESNWQRFPPRLPEQPIFYPVLSEQYAIQIARNWNTKDPNSGYVGYVLRFQVRQDFVNRFEPHRVGSSEHMEYWIPAEELSQFNDAIVGSIEVIHEYRLPQGDDESHEL